MTGDECRIVVVDGDPVRVRAAGEWNDDTRDAFAAIVRSARQKLAEQQAHDDELRDKLRTRKLLKPSEGAILVRKGRATVYRWIRDGLDVTEIAGQKYVDRKELLRWAADEERRTRRRTQGPK